MIACDCATEGKHYAALHGIAILTDFEHNPHECPNKATIVYDDYGPWKFRELLCEECSDEYAYQDYLSMPA